MLKQADGEGDSDKSFCACCYFPVLYQNVSENINYIVLQHFSTLYITVSTAPAKNGFLS